MRITVTNYLDVISSWCHWAAPMWAALQEQYAGRVDFTWKVALMDGSGFPKTPAQVEWFYRRSGLMMRSPFMLTPGWFEADLQECLAPNLVAEAARVLGVRDDRSWLALSHATLRDGRRTGEMETALDVASDALGLDREELRRHAESAAVEAQVRATTAEFHALQLTQRPAFVVQSENGDRAIFSGFVKGEPIAAALDAMLDDLAFYDAFAAHHGALPEA